MPETVKRFSREMLDEVVAEAVAEALGDRRNVAGYIGLADLIAKVGAEPMTSVDRETTSAD